MGGSERRSCGSMSGQRHYGHLGFTINREKNQYDPFYKGNNTLHGVST